MQNLVVVSHTVCAHVGGHKNLGTLGQRGPCELRVERIDLLHFL